MKKKKQPAKRVRAADTNLAHLEQLAAQMPPKEWKRAVERLAEDMASETARAESRAHAECEEALPWYIADEQRGENVRTRYPAVWHHLQSCSRCRQSYALIAQAPASASQPSSATRPALPFLQPAPHAPWHQSRAPRLAGGPPQIAFLLNAAHLNKLFANTSPLSLRQAREASASEGQALLFDDQMVIDDTSVDVQAWLVPSPQATGRFDIHLSIRSPVPLKTALQARLRWGTEEQMAYPADGEAVFENLPRLDLTSYPDIPSTEFQLILEPKD